MRTLFLLLVNSLLLIRSAVADKPRGIFVLQAVDEANVQESNLQKADGLSIRFKWMSVDKGSTWDWSFVDSQVDRCRKFGKPYMLRMLAGKHSPTRIDGEWFAEAPLPWNETAQSALSQAIEKLGERYASDPLLACVHLTSTANNRSAEMHIADRITLRPDYSHAKMITAWQKSIDSYSSAFPHTALSLNVALKPTGKGEITYPVIDYCKSKLGDRATFQHNALKARISPRWRGHLLILDLGQQGLPIGFQMACPSSNKERFGGSVEEAYRQAGEKSSYFEIYQGDL